MASGNTGIVDLAPEWTHNCRRLQNQPDQSHNTHFPDPARSPYLTPFPDLRINYVTGPANRPTPACTRTAHPPAPQLRLAALDEQLRRHFHSTDTLRPAAELSLGGLALTDTLEDQRELFRHFSRRTTTIGGDGDPENTLSKGDLLLGELHNSRNCGSVTMPSPLSTPVLTVDTAKIHKVDTANAQSLHGMWMVFSKCADYMEEGRRLENLSWRLWTRETFCVEPETSSEASVLPLLRSEAGDLPELSASVESAASDQAERIEQHIKRPKCMDYKPAVVRDDSLLSLARGKEKHITSLGLERMVLNIKEKKQLEPLTPVMSTVAPPVVDITPRPSTPTHSPSVSTAKRTPSPPPSVSTAKRTPSPPPYPLSQQPNQSTESCSTTAPEGNDSDNNVNATGSDTSVSSSGILPSRCELIKSPSIVRGFSPSVISSSFRSQPRLAAEPGPARLSTARPAPRVKNGKGMFLLGGSSGDDESSFEDRPALMAHRSSLSDSLSKPGASNLSLRKKVASFRDQDGTIKPIREGPTDNEDAVESEDEVSESAIEDSDSDWEDSVTESGRSSVEERELFQRVDSRPNLVSRRSLLTLMMHQPTKMGVPSRSSPALQRSRTSPNGPSIPASPPDDDDENLTMRGPGVPRSKPIVMKPTPQSVAHSPRTTRRNMLATELTESLRRHLLWERQQKSATANAFLKRRHTAHDMANLQEYPGPKGSQNEQSSAQDKTGSWNNYTDFGPWEYHVKGW
ncbi:DUF1752-domain-containing protein [Aspergillus heteromorphus CBS 117.55]|uniref:DUF1752-domain-containing protein n=1 Tax=Aspergillus heteromorphus CBS 117.55 TaxID=1448321 RepID=A0A317VV44_9EURO|nr:DUF1752-domain-containing protein [Aspergillus heteromorphus CBS 117.55]PWY78274.1 DUF1752-domain-containing protein [Aspergillus heteromorphus CBS 117.55]